jgi:PAS domain S-box-containing protein
MTAAGEQSVRPRARCPPWNRAAEHMYGWSAEEAVGRKAEELLQTKLSEDELACLRTLLDQMVTCSRWRSSERARVG